MAKFIAYVRGKPLLNGFKRRDFHWNEDFRCYIYQGKIYGEEQFNEIIEIVQRQHYDMNPSFRLVEMTPRAPSAPSAPIEDLDAAPVPITEEAAIAALQRLAPHRLRKALPSKSVPTEAAV